MTILQSRPWKLSDPLSLRFDGPSHIYRLGFCVTCGLVTRDCPRIINLYGTASSGNYGHAGRPGQVGGSASEGGGDSFQQGEGAGGIASATESSKVNVSGGGAGDRTFSSLAGVHGEGAKYFEERGTLPSPKDDPGYEGGYTAEQHAAANAVIAHAMTLPQKPLQPLVEPTVKKGAPELDDARKLLATEKPGDKKTKVHEDRLIDLLDQNGGNAREQFEELLRLGKEANPDMSDMVDSMVDELGGRRVATTAPPTPEELDPEKMGAIAMQGPVKTMERSVKKVIGKDDGNAANIRDVVRMSLAVDHVDNLEDARAAAIEAIKAEGGEVITAEDRFSHPNDAGYRDLALGVRMKNGLIGEVQVHLKSMLYAKEVLGGHKMYERTRTLQERSLTQRLTPEENQEIADLNAEMKKLYEGAWRYAGGK